MTALTTPKVHQFFPLEGPQLQKIKSPSYGSPESIPEYRRNAVPAGSTIWTFEPDSHPYRVDDILLEDPTSRRIMPNRQAPRIGTRGEVIFDREAYTYDPATRIVTFKKPTEQAFNMHWFDPSKARSWNDQWVQFALEHMLIQGSNYIDEAMIPPNETKLTGKFQGSFRCFPEIVSQPKTGVVRLSDDLRGFAYRGRIGFTGLDSFEFLIYNALGQVSDVYCYTFQCS